MDKPIWHILPEKGERILWQGRPQRCCGIKPWWGLLAAAAFLWALLLWGITGPVPPGAEGFHDWSTFWFCRMVLVILSSVFTAAPFLAARSTNGSTYVITDKRIAISKPLFRHGHYTESYPWKSIHSTTICPLGEGLASFRFEGYTKEKLESSTEIIWAIPAAIAADMEILFHRANTPR